MRVAILHDYLNQLGGAERVLEVILDLFPEADLYTLFHDPVRTEGRFAHSVTKTSALDVPFVRRRHRAFIPLLPWAAGTVTSPTRYDLVISSTASYAKGFAVDGLCHVAYCYTPLRYAWEREYVDAIPFLPEFAKRAIAPLVARSLQKWDYAAAQRPNTFIAISEHIAGKVRAYYRRDPEIIYPPVDTEKFFPEPIGSKRPYFLMVGRLLHYKRFDLGIQAAARIRQPLRIVGSGPDGLRLQRMANPAYVEFIPRVTDQELRLLYSNATALVFPQVEDFGLVAAEALACGTPVVSYRRGGGGEIVDDGVTGVLVGDQTTEAFAEGMRLAAETEFNRSALRAAAERFSVKRFQREFLGAIHAAGVPVEVPAEAAVPSVARRLPVRVPARLAYARRR